MHCYEAEELFVIFVDLIQTVGHYCECDVAPTINLVLIADHHVGILVGYIHVTTTAISCRRGDNNQIVTNCVKQSVQANVNSKRFCLAASSNVSFLVSKQRHE